MSNGSFGMYYRDIILDDQAPRPAEPVRPPVEIVSDAEDRISVPPGNLSHWVDDIQRWPNDPVTIMLQHFFVWTSEERAAVFSFADRVWQEVFYCSVAGAQRHPSPLSPVLELLEGFDPGSLDAFDRFDQFDRNRRAVLELVVRLHPGALPMACGLLAQRLSDLGRPEFTRQGLLAEARTMLGSEAGDGANAGAGENGDDEPEHETPSLEQSLIDAPLPPGLTAPPGYQISMDGVVGFTDDVTSTPLLVVGRVVDIVDRAESLRLMWWRDGEWVFGDFDRMLLATGSIVRLSRQGIDVTSQTAKAMIDYIRAAELHARDSLPITFVTNTFGWLGENGVDGFLWGRRHFRLPGSQRTFTFQGRSTGEEQRADAFTSRGSLEAWQGTIRSLEEHPRAQLAIIASMAAPLLEVLKVSSFGVNYARTTSHGKTTLLYLAANIWGKPEAVMLTWNSTPKFLGDMAAMHSDLPLIVDETQQARDRKMLSQVTFDVINGKSRGRSSAQGVQATREFRTELITSGESRITAASQDGGTRARTLEVRANPFGAANAATGPLVRGLLHELSVNYGVAGPRFIQFIVDHSADWPRWGEWHRRLEAFYVARSGDDPVTQRKAGYFATLHLTAILAWRAGILPWRCSRAIANLWPELTADAPEADRSADALRLTWDWCTENKQQFFNLRGRSRKPNKIVGRWDRRPGGTWSWLGLTRRTFEKIMKDCGFEPGAILDAWQGRGWLLTSENRQWYRTRVDGQHNDLVAIRREAIVEILSLGTSPPETPETTESPEAREPAGGLGARDSGGYRGVTDGSAPERAPWNSLDLANAY